MQNFGLITRRLDSGTQITGSSLLKVTETWCLFGLVPIYTRDFIAG